ncbi:cytochrome d ubiquinol oxidase subunit 2 [[Haemophilus] ducreyi]|uniref:Cytochrome D ubiquinol oxidase, subunit II n=2 Tax=Haemophilus ducreyi TaxID=730 RepID=Q7VKT7_HAEDU|nr:cytochrome d ubiquinol oxidase subunit II [[Haemophilus] ducreyi]AAP96533.1 cytochrome D ubiquinol oxidase, subunit II [[Haemophilus] ducreyi 35000HP]AKO31387.1 cytochrome d ubiquinol oxidase subunit 2 [[Haemophilus] ducreyi]AKO32839.1 cytochrome d ubiquinol oxidase subunit 2 [[Haemophilus] ducreyi]AKO34288.1 cytochrome d ubiquinol oxidase subunit 2 [[Haemophilus] ducreyi]AKO35731.1 cytochrome d ubiquinol oxidase subunit 2 [[Haemophilus] ducreyi]
MIDYEILRFIWWILIAVLLIGFAITDGFDMGVLTLLPIIGKSNVERRVMINTVAPHWDGNQVWLLTAGGAIFAAWPTVYAVSFSGFYLAMILVLAALFFRPVGFEYRAKIDSPKWRNAWDWGLFVGGFVPSLIFGVAFGNLLQGVPFEFNELNQAQYTGSFFGLLNPFALLCGALSLTMLMTQGATWLQMKTTGDLRYRARSVAQLAAIIVLVIFILAGVWLYFKDGFIITSDLDHNAKSLLSNKTVAVENGAWFRNFFEMPVLWIVPMLAILGAMFTVIASKANRSGFAFFSSSIMLLGVILTAVVSMFPFIMPSISHPEMSLTVWDSTASKYTLTVMLIVACIFVPMVLAYTGWTYYKMFGRLDAKYLEDNKASAY